MKTPKEIKRGLDACSCLDSICDEVCPYSAIKFPECRQTLLLDAFRLIDRVPTINTIEVVRCKDCGVSERAPIGEGYLYCNHTSMVVSENDYCSYGEPKMCLEIQNEF